MRDLAEQIVRDAEGGSKFVRIEVSGTPDDAKSADLGRAIAASALWRSAVHGADPNWGRILSAIGTTAAAFESDGVDVAINGVWICRGGEAGDDRSKVDLSDRAVTVTVNLNSGKDAATVRTNDLSLAYVHENSAYSS